MPDITFELSTVVNNTGRGVHRQESSRPSHLSVAASQPLSGPCFRVCQCALKQPPLGPEQ